MSQRVSYFILTLFFVLSLALSACASPSPATQAASTTAPSGAPASTAAVPASGGQTTQPALNPNQVTVKMVGTTFEPQNITVKVGATVVWENTSTLTHNVVAVDGSFKSANVDPGGTYQNTFTTPGKFGYYCSYHGTKDGQGMYGTVTVTATP